MTEDIDKRSTFMASPYMVPVDVLTTGLQVEKKEEYVSIFVSGTPHGIY